MNLPPADVPLNLCLCSRVSDHYRLSNGYFECVHDVSSWRKLVEFWLKVSVMKSLVWNHVQPQQLSSGMHSEHPELLKSSAAALSYHTEEQHLGQK